MESFAIFVCRMEIMRASTARKPWRHSMTLTSHRFLSLIIQTCDANSTIRLHRRKIPVLLKNGGCCGETSSAELWKRSREEIVDGKLPIDSPSTTRTGYDRRSPQKTSADAWSLHSCHSGRRTRRSPFPWNSFRAGFGRHLKRRCVPTCGREHGCEGRGRFVL